MNVQFYNSQKILHIGGKFFIIAEENCHVKIVAEWRAGLYLWRKCSTSGLIMVFSEFIVTPRTTVASTPDTPRYSSPTNGKKYLTFDLHQYILAYYSNIRILLLQLLNFTTIPFKAEFYLKTLSSVINSCNNLDLPM